MAVMGPSGSGKTTLLNTISGRMQMCQGSIKLNSNKLTRSLRRQIAYVLQKDIFPSKLTLREMLHFTAMIQLPEKMSIEQKKKRIDNIVSVMELEKCLDTVMGNSMNRGLSGGEMKRANIACELLTDPNIIIIDVVFHGEASRCLDVFETYGLYCAEHYNPADFILDSVQYINENVKQMIKDSNVNKYMKNQSQSTDINSEETREVPSANNGEVSFLIPREEAYPKWPTSFFTQFYWLAWRNYKQSKTRIISKFEIARAIILSIFLGLVYFQLERTEDKIREYKGLLFFLVTHWTFQPLLEAVLSFPTEKEILYKERAAGYYRLSAYYLAKIVSEAPLTLVLPMFSFIIVCMFAGLYRPGVLFASMGTLVFHAVLSQGFGILFGVIFLDTQWALTLSTVFTVVNMLVAGFYAETFPSWLTWSRNISFLAYSYNILIYLEFSHGDPVKCLNITLPSNFGLCRDAVDYVPSNLVIEMSKIDLPLFANVILLIILFVATRLASYLVLHIEYLIRQFVEFLFFLFLFLFFFSFSFHCILFVFFFLSVFFFFFFLPVIFSFFSPIFSVFCFLLFFIFFPSIFFLPSPI
ncbi:unnamed protein product [Acanthosepion pharaonis]|uniref:ABC transporter domain-containing protein n=1 Tax=Acanthosepion pharaonis TaxID=158019 RepID=A0A812CPQ1_ACAPH|nr:unnamed protein product [Sepia pharaonis]